MGEIGTNDACLGGARADLKIGQLSKIKINKPNGEEIDRIKTLSVSLDEAYKKYLSLYQQIMGICPIIYSIAISFKYLV